MFFNRIDHKSYFLRVSFISIVVNPGKEGYQLADQPQ